MSLPNPVRLVLDELVLFLVLTFVVGVYEVGAQGLGLLLGLGADVVGEDLAPEAVHDRDGLQAGDRHPEDEDVGRLRCPGGGGEHGDVLAQRVGRYQGAFVAGDRTHRREGVHGSGRRSCGGWPRWRRP